MTQKMSNADVRAVLDSDELTCDVTVVAAGVGMTVWAYYEAVKRGDAPIMPIKVGRRQRYRVSDLRQLLLGRV
jgi:hypothetical protein